MHFNIDAFWRNRLELKLCETTNLQPGWVSKQAAFDVFVEAPLSQSNEFGGADPKVSEIILVSAPGAVGKSTLAKQIAASTGAVYIDLAAADPVGGNFLSGGLAKAGLFGDWQAGATAVLIDGLDEARLRVTQAAFASFLGDVVQLSRGRSVPTVLFGRTGSIQETWLMISEHGLDAPVLEIGYYEAPQSVDFALARVRGQRPDRDHEGPEREAIAQLIDGLRSSTSQDGDRFAGYAPVLMAVADRVVGEANPSALVANIKAGWQLVTLENVVDSILTREHGKLSSLEFASPKAAAHLYAPLEQLDRLCARVYGLPDPELPVLDPADAQIYGQALETWVPEHPFLDGAAKPSSAVFAARIAAHALQSPRFEEHARRAELTKGVAANPFLAEFYLSAGGDEAHAPPEHLGILYSSLRATLALGDSANLHIEPLDEGADDEAALAATVEISVDRKGHDKQDPLVLRTEQVGSVQLGPHVEDVDITFPLGRIEMGSGPEITIVAPVNIQCGKLSIESDRVIVESSAEDAVGAVYLEAEEFTGVKILTVPTVRGKASLSVAWPGATAHPWNAFSTSPLGVADPGIDEGLRRLRKFVIAFRSHSKGSLRRYRAKLDHARMTKGVGQSILNALKEQGIISVAGEMYELDADALGSKAGATYAESMSRQFSERTVKFVEEVLREA